ncbi:MAG: dihydropteroate synthase [Prevotella sp.]|nr:dihydropteroate synthase [Prevotella sp.]
MQYLINIRGKLVDLRKPRVMGILNATPDSFYEGSRVQTEHEIARRTNQIIDEGGWAIDVGAYSTRPGAADVTEAEETDRLRQALAIVRREQPEAIVSVDTFRPAVARMAIEEFGADIINDVSGGNAQGAFGGEEASLGEGDNEMFRVVARAHIPYIYMSRAKDIETMLLDFAQKTQLLHALGQKDIILDPGFGFGKSLDDNYRILASLQELQAAGHPLLVGLSRKSMIWRLLGSTPDDALNGTTVLNTIALQRGANILRVHDVRQAADAITLCGRIEGLKI